MSEHIDLELDCHGHQVRVTHRDVPNWWTLEDDTTFTVCIDGCKTAVPGIWRAYRTHGDKGIRLLIEAFLKSCR